MIPEVLDFVGAAGFPVVWIPEFWWKRKGAIPGGAGIPENQTQEETGTGKYAYEVRILQGSGQKCSSLQRFREQMRG